MADPKRPPVANDGDGAPPGKKQKSNEGSPVNYSEQVKRKLQLASRTGQACDRCKERKMRCDPDPSGCGPCKQKQLNCVTTDRITGRASERGQVERLEARIHALEGHLGTYAERFGRLDNVDLSTSNGYGSSVSTNPYISDTSQTQNLGLLAAYTRSEPSANRPVLRYGPVRGSKIDILGSEIDISVLPSADMEEPSFATLNERPLYNKSYKSFLYTSTGRQKGPDKPTLPDPQVCHGYVDLYFKFVGPYTAVVHRPTVEALFDKFHNDRNFTPTPAQTVIVYMVLATWIYQYGIRNGAKEALEMTKLSNTYYHYCLGFWPDLKAGETLEDMEALSLFCVFSRNFPKPSFSWSLCRQIFNKAIEQNYHRSPSKDSSPAVSKLNYLELERRKRVFWSLLTLNVNISMKLGRPLPITMADMDVEMPLEVDDAEITPDGVVSSTSTRCNIRPAILIYKMMPMWTDLYKDVLSVQKSGPEYIAAVNSLEYRLSLWEQEMMRDNGRLWEGGDWTLIISRLLLDSWACEFRLLLHHPTLDVSGSRDFESQNLDLCHKSAQKLLGNVKELILDYKGADFTWHMTSVYVLAIGVTMHVDRQKKGRITQESIGAIEQELMEWLMVIGSAGQILSQSNDLHDLVKPKVDQCLAEIHNVFLASSALQNGYRQEQQQNTNSQQHETRPPVTYAPNEPFQGNYPDPSGTQLSHLDHSHTDPRSAPSGYTVDDSRAAAAAVAVANQYAYGYTERPSNQPRVKYEQHTQHQPFVPHDTTAYPNSTYASTADTDALIAASSTAAQGAPNIHPQMMYPNITLAGTARDYAQTANHPASALMSLSRNDQTSVGGGALVLEGVEQAAMWPHNIGFPNQNGY